VCVSYWVNLLQNLPAVGTGIYFVRHDTNTHLNPRFLSEMTSCDAASSICQALSRGNPRPVRDAQPTLAPGA
jgi:hypothetical protein